jgi:hypothetical protein
MGIKDADAPKKVISKNVMETCTFFTFTHVCQTCFTYNFIVCIFFTTKKFFGVILAFFENFEAKRTKNS